MAQSYKHLKEDFVSNLSGGSIGEINTVTAVAPVSALLYRLIFEISTDLDGEGCLSAVVSPSNAPRVLPQ